MSESKTRKVGPGGREFSPWQLIADLYDVANDHEAQVIWELLVKSGWCWKCKAPGHTRPCGAVVDFDAEECADCGAPRPVEVVEEMEVHP